MELRRKYGPVGVAAQKHLENNAAVSVVEGKGVGDAPGVRAILKQDVINGVQLDVALEAWPRAIQVVVAPPDGAGGEGPLVLKNASAMENDRDQIAPVWQIFKNL